MELENEIAEALNRAVDDKGVGRKKIQDWTVCHLSRSRLTDLIYEHDGCSVAYGFDVRLIDGFVVFENYLREASPKHQGIGTSTLKQLEGALQELAISRNQPVIPVFDPFGQADTKRWLQKNNYENRNGVYVKEFKPQKL